MEIVSKCLGSAPRFEGSRPHTPAETIDLGLAAAREASADAIVAVGGSSAVDCAKGIAVLLATGKGALAELSPTSFDRLFEEHWGGARPVPLLAVTTTLSFAEFLPFWGVRHADRLRKVPYSDLECVERTVFLDGELVRHTPDNVWLQTGIKALDDAFAAWCRGSEDEPFLDPLLREAISTLTELLPRSRGEDSAAIRQQVLTAVWMTKFSLPRLGTAMLPAWFSTTARHSLGAVYAVPHGAASCVALPHALRYHAEATRSRQFALASALGWRAEGAAPLYAGLDQLLDQLQVPRQLSALGIGPEKLSEVVAAMRSEAPLLGGDEELQKACAAML
jgi:alcohol dehydrogenase class IV